MADIQFVYNQIVEDDCFGMAPKESPICKSCGAYDLCRDIVGKAEEQEVVKRLQEEATLIKNKGLVAEKVVEEATPLVKTKKSTKVVEAYNSLVNPFINYLKAKDSFKFIDKDLQGLVVMLPNEEKKSFITIKSYKKENTKYNIVFSATAKDIPGLVTKPVTSAYNQTLYEGSSFEELIGIIDIYYEKMKGGK